jgi:integrase
MPVRRDERNGNWYFRATVVRYDGRKERVFGVPGVPGAYQQFPNTKIGALAAEQRAIQLASIPPTPPTTLVPTFEDWFHGRFWREWVIGRKNKPTEVRSKKIIYRLHLGPRFGLLRLDQIRVTEIAQLRADLVECGLGEKRINNILAVLSKPLKYAEDCGLITKAPKVGMYKVERPEIVAWDFAQYARLLAAAKVEGDEWYAAVALAGEAGLRVGEIKALRWREDVDMIAKTITVSRQVRNKETTTPKGRTRRTIPMTTALHEALKRMSVVREGLVIRNLDGTAKTDDQADKAITRICRRAGLPVHLFHTLRHSFATHAALFGVNPWRLQAWLGHKRIEETMRYVHVAENHAREIPEHIQRAARGVDDPDRRVLAMLGARGSAPAEAEARIQISSSAAGSREA